MKLERCKRLNNNVSVLLGNVFIKLTILQIGPFTGHIFVWNGLNHKYNISYILSFLFAIIAVSVFCYYLLQDERVLQNKLAKDKAKEEEKKEQERRLERLKQQVLLKLYHDKNLCLASENCVYMD